MMSFQDVTIRIFVRPRFPCQTLTNYGQNRTTLLTSLQKSPGLENFNRRATVESQPPAVLEDDKIPLNPDLVIGRCD